MGALVGSLAAALGGCAGSSDAKAVAGPRPGDARTIVAGVDPGHLRSDVDRMAAFGTRHTASETTSDVRGIGAARRWCRARFEEATAGTDARVYFDSHLVPADGRNLLSDVEVVNVVCEIPGSQPASRDRLYYVLAHLDSRASDGADFQSDAPGANDDASGVALLLELARVLANAELDSTVVLVATSGEEQGLYGARLHEEAATTAGRDIRAVLNNDTVGDPYGVYAPDSERGRWARGLVRMFAQGVPDNASEAEVVRISRLGAENDSPARTLARYIGDVSMIHDLPVRPLMIYRNDRFLRGGDHTPFVRAGYPAVRFTVPFEDYDRQHQDVRVVDDKQFGDLPEYINEDYLADVTRLNAAALVHLANAPSVPGDARMIVADLTTDTTIRWSASPEPDVAGYEVVWRETTSPVWQYYKDVGSVTEATVPLSKDNWLMGIRAYDHDGYRSPVAFPGAASE